MTEQEKAQFRLQALNIAERLNPSRITTNQSLGYTSPKEKSVSELLKDADKIFEWIIK